MEMYKKIIVLAVIMLSAVITFAQPSQYTPMTAQGYQFKRILTDSTLHLPSFCGVPTLRNSTAKNGALAIDTCNSRLYKWTNGAGWSIVGGSTIDTTSLSNRINTKIDSLKRSVDSIYAKINGSWIFMYKDSIGGGGSTPSFEQVIDNGNQITKYDTIQMNTNTKLYFNGKIDTAYGGGNYNLLEIYNGNTGGYIWTEFENGNSQYLDQNNFQILTNYCGIQSNDFYLSANECSIYNTFKGIGSLLPVFTEYNKTDIIDSVYYPFYTTNYFPGFYSYMRLGSFSGIGSEIYNGNQTDWNKINPNVYESGYGTYYVRIIPTYNANDEHYLPISDNITDTLATLADVRNGATGFDTTNLWVTSVTQPNDSTIRVVKGASTNDYVIRSAVAGSATRLVTTVYNNSGATITKGSVVYINGRHSSNLPTVAKAQANTEANSYSTFALVENDIANNNSGIVIQAGNITNLNLPTSSYTDGQVVYLSPTVAGGITTTKPFAPDHIVKLGTVTRAHPTFGTIELKIENGWQMDELSDVQIAAVPNDSTLLQFSRVDSLWHAVGITNAIGSNYIKPTDTSVFQRNNIAAYSFKANNTNASANVTDQAFRDTSGVYSSTITWTGTTAPSGTANHSFRFTRIGKQVTANIHLNYGTAGSTLTAVQMALPASFPTPAEPTGLGAANDMLYPAVGYLNTANTVPTGIPRAALRVNPADNGWELYIIGGAGNYKAAWISVTYYTN